MKFSGFVCGLDEMETNASIEFFRKNELPNKKHFEVISACIFSISLFQNSFSPVPIKWVVGEGCLCP